MKTPEEQQLAEEQIKEIQIEYLYRIADFSIGELLKKFVEFKNVAVILCLILLLFIVDGRSGLSTF